MSSNQLLPRRGGITQTAAKIAALIHTAEAFVAKRAAAEAEVDAKLADVGFELDAVAVGKHATAAAVVAVANQIEPRLRKTLREAADNAGNVIHQAVVDMNSLHQRIDDEIKAAVAAAIPAGLGRVEFDHRSSDLFKTEAARRLQWNGLGGAHIPSADLQQLVAALRDRLAALERVGAEQDRCAGVIRDFEKKAA